MKRKEIEKIYNQLSIKTNLKVQIILSKNKIKMREEFELISEIRKQLFLEHYIECMKSVDELIVQYGDRKSDNSYKINNQKEYVEKKKSLDECYEDIIKEQLVRNLEFNKFLEEDLNIDFEYYSLEDLPEDLSKYSQEEIDVLIKFVGE